MRGTLVMTRGLPIRMICGLWIGAYYIVALSCHRPAFAQAQEDQRTTTSDAKQLPEHKAATPASVPDAPRPEEADKAEPCEARTLTLEGFNRVRKDTIENILPRSLPARLMHRELEELERRLWTTALFDEVAVTCEEGSLRVRAQEKWTLVPGFDFATSRSLKDSYFFGSLVESNFLGRAQELGVYGAYAERAFSGEAWWAESQAFANKATLEAGVSYVGSGLFFSDSDFAWERRRAGARIAVRMPFRYDTRWRFALGGQGYREILTGSLPLSSMLQSPGLQLADGFAGVLVFRAVWDNFKWNDVIPAGVRFATELSPGLMMRERGVASRHNVIIQGTGSIPLFGQTILAWNAVFEGVSPGDPNHSTLLGNVANQRFSLGTLGGVRGLPDNLYRNAAQLYGNLELRMALTLAPRWYLQAVAFVDAGAFAPMNALGKVQHASGSLAVGAGLRLLPTAIASLVPRIDVGHNLSIDSRWFFTFGFSQYFGL
jgi:hypothetical protein